MNSKIKEILTRDLLEVFKNNNMDQNSLSKIEAKIAEMGEFIPTVGIFGKTGAGKSSLCNALFGKETTKVSDVHACTRNPQEIFIKISESGSGIKLIDLPGVGEDSIRDEEYSALYKEWIPKLDLVLWVMKADDRTFSIDEKFYDHVVKSHIEKTPFIVVINQVDKVNPIREWNTSKCAPGIEQEKIIKERIVWASSKFGISSSDIVAVSAFEKYNLAGLVETIIDLVPNEKKLGFFNQMEEECITEKVKESTAKGILETIRDFCVEIKPYIPEIISVITYIFGLLKKSK